MLQKPGPPAVIQSPQTVPLSVLPLLMQEGLKSPGHPVPQRHPVALPLAVIRQPLGPGPLFFAVSRNLALRPRVSAERVLAGVGEILYFLDLLICPARRRPGQQHMEAVGVDVEPGVGQCVRPRRVYLPERRRQGWEVRVCAATGVYPALVGRAQRTGGAVAGYHV